MYVYQHERKTGKNGPKAENRRQINNKETLGVGKGSEKEDLRKVMDLK
jgi:hypothetical protein